jgi:GntR family transcriptional regulator
MQNMHTQPPTRFTTRPLYLQVRDVLASRIASQEWKPSTVIPNEGDLAREFDVSSGTMRKALDLLEAERLLTRRQGRGTFVNDPASEDLSIRYTRIWGLKGERITGDISLARIEEDQSNEAERLRLRLKPTDRVQRVQRVRAYKGEPFLVEDVALPAELFPGLAERKDATPRIVSLAQEFGILLGKCEERVYVGTAAADVAQHLKLAPDAPVLVLDRLIYDLDGRPVEWRLGRGNFVGKYYLAEFM